MTSGSRRLPTHEPAASPDPPETVPASQNPAHAQRTPAIVIVIVVSPGVDYGRSMLVGLPWAHGHGHRHSTCYTIACAGTGDWTNAVVLAVRVDACIMVDA